MRQILLCLTLLLLCCCAQNEQTQAFHQKRHAYKPTRQDGAPKHPKNIRYVEVAPKSEPMSRYGNPDSYRVDGRNYEVLPSSLGYKTRGIASWYGTKFHKQRTSSGEKYDMYAMTAAHRTLPLPSYIRVKNMDNGRIAIVRVNDRGPFHSSRLIDLSYAAAKYLGVLPGGTARVEVQTLRPKNERTPRIAHYYIQAGAFNSKWVASDLNRKLRRMMRPPVFVEEYDHRFIVKIGPFPNKKACDQAKAALKKQHIPGVFSVLQ